MIYHPVEKLAGAGIQEILIVTGLDHMGDVVNLLGSGKEFGVRFTYKVQDEAGGIAQALGLAENFCGGSKMAAPIARDVLLALQRLSEERPYRPAAPVSMRTDGSERG